MFLTFVFGFFTISIMAQSEQEKLFKTEARYDGNANNGYYFREIQGEKIIKFTRWKQGVLKNTDLEDESAIGKLYSITYRIDQVQVDDVKNDKSMDENVSYFKKVFVLIELKEKS